MNDSEGSERQQRLSDRTVAIVLAEATALLIALATTLVPGRTGSTWSPADVVFEDPSFVERVAASFLLVNMVLLVLGAATWILVRRSRSP